MNRKIKFRGNDYESNEWLYGNLIQRAGRFPGIMFDYEYNGKIYYAEHPVKQETVGQFTGLHDKNGKEIYEGDILLDGYAKYEVWYSEDRAGFIAEMIDPQNNLVDYLGGYDTERIMTVIGNIHDNPELLKGGEV